jgi:hypothetical protein
LFTFENKIQNKKRNLTKIHVILEFSIKLPNGDPFVNIIEED